MIISNKPNKRRELGFTLSEMMMSVAMGSLVIAATMSASVALQKSFAAANDFFYTHMQQIRIIDYLSRDVKRSTVVVTSADKQTVTCTIPNLIIKAGDPDAGLGVGKRRTPTITVTSNGAVVNYGATTTTASYSVSGQSIVRTENGVVTTIASSTDQLVPQTLDTELANTEYADCNVTFLPTFTFNPPANPSPSATPDPTLLDKRNGTAIYARAYLRNKRRG
jgi:Tfp pilus assembly protein PilW